MLRRAAFLEVALVCSLMLACPRGPQPSLSWSDPSSRFTVVAPPNDGVAPEQLEIRDVEALPEAGVLAAGLIGGAGLLLHIDGHGVVTERRLGELLVDVALAPDGTAFAIGWGDGQPTLWQLSSQGEVLETHALPRSGVGAEPYRVLPSGIVLGTHNPVTSGVLNGWVVRREGDTWTERTHHGGGYSGFLDGALTPDGFVAVGMGSRAAAYQGWIVVERAGATLERHLDQEYGILHGAAPLSDGSLLVVGKGRAARLDRDLQVIETLQWSDPSMFEYAQVVVSDDAAWLLARRGGLRFQFTETVTYRIPLRPEFGPISVVRTDADVTGGALVRLSDGSLRCVLSTASGEILVDRL